MLERGVRLTRGGSTVYTVVHVNRQHVYLTYSGGNTCQVLLSNALDYIERGRWKIVKKKEKDMNKKPDVGYIVVNTSKVTVISTDRSRMDAPPTIIHHTRRSAEQEAARLARQHEGSTFMVFKTCHAAVVSTPVVTFDY